MLDQSVPNPVASNPNFNTHKVFAAIGLILILSVLIIGGTWAYISSQDKGSAVEDLGPVKVTTSSAKPVNDGSGSKVSTNPDKNKAASEYPWKTFTSAEFKYTFQYPGNYTSFKNDFTEEEFTQEVTIKPSKYTEDQVGTPNIKFIGNPGSDTCSERPDMDYKCIKESLLIGGKSATKITASNNINYIQYIIDVDGKNFDISANNIKGFEKLLDKILSTVKFL